MPVAQTRFRILGPLEVLADGRKVRLGGPQQRALLALLLLDADRVVSTDRLVADLWARSRWPPRAASCTAAWLACAEPCSMVPAAHGW